MVERDLTDLRRTYILLDMTHFGSCCQDHVAKLLGISIESLRGGLNLVQAAEVLGIAPSTLRSRAKDGKIGYQRDGRAWRFYWWHLGGYLESREHPAIPDQQEKADSAQVTARSSVTLAKTDPEPDVQAEAREIGLI